MPIQKANTYSGVMAQILSPTGEQVGQTALWTWEEMVGVNASVTSRTGGYTQKNSGAYDARGSIRYLIDKNNQIHMKAGDKWRVKLYADPTNEPNDWIDCIILIGRKTKITDNGGSDIGGDCDFEVDGEWTPNGRFAATALPGGAV